MTDVVKEVGESDFQDSSRDIYSTGKGDYFATVIGNACMCTLWYRKDLLAEAGVKVPVYFDEWLDVAKKTTKGGRYGVALPLWQEGHVELPALLHPQRRGWLGHRSGHASHLNSPQTVAALEFLRRCASTTRPAPTTTASTRRSGLRSGVAATSIYTGRVLGNVETQNPKISDQIACARFPMRREGGRPWASCSLHRSSFPGAKTSRRRSASPSGSTSPTSISASCTARPATSCRRSVRLARARPTSRTHPRKAQPEVAQLLDNVSFGRSPAKPSPKHKFIFKAGDIIGGDVMAEVLQRGGRERPRQDGGRLGPGSDRADHEVLSARAVATASRRSGSRRATPAPDWR